MEKMIEKAKEELELLETNHPHRFDYLKLELKSFISLLQSQLLPDPLPTTSSATTQASTSMKRKRICLKRRKMDGDGDGDGGWETDDKSVTKNGKKVMRRQKDRVDVALQKAQSCLRKIQEFKFSLVC